ncbi:MAG TPA: sulfate ABC transporter substrate-binding protein [Pirellulales bacterium]|jgi:sulfate transport system substrate-binding protein|nr:sulfate ABC transporter substrate-binding protein [Pirellulales bacterium]
MPFCRSTRAPASVAGLLLALSLAGCGGGGSSSANAAKSGAGIPAAAGEPVRLLHVSYDPTRELWKAVNVAFAADYLKENGVEVEIQQSHGGASPQTRAVIDGLDADVVSLPLPTDTQAIANAGLIKEGWEERLPNHSLPYTSTIVFVVRKGNPKQIKDWPDLVQDKIEIITPNPKTSGNGKLSFLAAWGSALKRGGSAEDAKRFVTEIYKRVPVLESGARAATVTFAKKEIGDVHLTWESEAFLEIDEAKGELELVVPSVSILAEPRVAVVDANVDRHGTRGVAEDYLKFFYTPAAQKIIAEHYYRPIDTEVLAQFPDRFAAVDLFTVRDVAESWEDADKRFFADNAVFDGIYSSVAR